MDAVARLLSDLVAIPSVNPMGRADGGPDYLEGRLTAYLEDFFRAREIRCERRTVAPGRDNLLAFFSPPRARRTLLFDVHQDTVPVDGMTIPPFQPRIEGDRLFGRGSCDIKGAMAAMLLALARLHTEQPDGSAAVVLACTVDEEYTHTGARQLARDRIDAELAIVAEPTQLDLVVAHKGAVRWKIRTRGTACHSSSPELGDNAIYRMARVVTALADHAATLAKRPPDPLLGPPTLSVGRITGGQSVNIVPDGCEIEIDRRSLPGEDTNACQAQVADAIREHLGSLDAIESLPPWVLMPALKPGVPDRLLEPIRDTVARVSGRVPKVRGVPFGTDAGPLSQAGMPCLVLGPGNIAQAHTRDEWVELDQVRAACDIYFELARRLGSDVT